MPITDLINILVFFCIHSLKLLDTYGEKYYSSFSIRYLFHKKEKQHLLSIISDLGLIHSNVTAIIDFILWKWVEKYIELWLKCLMELCFFQKIADFLIMLTDNSCIKWSIIIWFPIEWSIAFIFLSFTMLSSFLCLFNPRLNLCFDFFAEDFEV